MRSHLVKYTVKPAFELAFECIYELHFSTGSDLPPAEHSHSVAFIPSDDRSCKTVQGALAGAWRNSCSKVTCTSHRGHAFAHGTELVQKFWGLCEELELLGLLLAKAFAILF